MGGRSVYFKVSDKIPPVPDLYCISIQRHRLDLGVSIVLPATSELMARREAFRLFPEYKYGLAITRVSLVRYVELDWDADRYTVGQREKQSELRPSLPAAERKPKRLPRSGEAGEAE